MIVTHQDEMIREWMSARMPHGQTCLTGAVCIGWARDGKLVAGVAYDGFNGASICMHVAAEGSNWLTREFLWFAFYYPFEQLNVKKVIGLVWSTNAKAIRFDEHIGFQLECRIADAVPGGDLLVYSMTRAQCRYLTRKQNGRKVE